MTRNTPLRRPNDQRILGGVIGGVARFYGIEPLPLRLLVCFLGLIYGTGIVAYLIAWIIIPNE